MISPTQTSVVNKKPKGKPRGKPWQVGHSGNPGGFTKATRARRIAVAAALDEALTVKEIVDGKEISTDLLVEAIKLGVQEREPSLVRLACEYRWGKPIQPIEDVTDVESIKTKQLLAQLPEALEVLGDGWEQ